MLYYKFLNFYKIINKKENNRKLNHMDKGELRNMD